MLNREVALSKQFFTFHNIIWWLFSLLLLVLALLEDYNQLILKYLIPIIFISIVSKEGRINLNNTGLIFYLIFTAWACLSLLYTVNMQMTLGYLQVMLGNSIIWYVTLSCVQKIKDVRLAAFPLLIAFLIHVYYEFTTSVESYQLGDIEVNALTGLTNNPNALGFLLWYGVVIATLLLLNSKKYLFKILYILTIGLFIYGILNTGSRKTLFATLLFGGALAYLIGKGKNYLFLIIIAIIGFISYEYIYTFIMDSTTVGTRLSDELVERGVDRREELIGEGWQFFLANPIIGIGLGAFTTYSKDHAMSHNDYIEILASMGFPALLIYLYIYFDFGKSLIKSLNKNLLYAISMAFLLGYLSLGLGRPAFLDIHAILLFAFFQGLISQEQHTKTIST